MNPFDPDSCHIDVLVTELAGNNLGQVRVQVHIVDREYNDVVVSDGQTIVSGNYEDDEWAASHDRAIAEERGDAERKFLAALGIDDDDYTADVLNLHGGGDLPSPA